jgi:hypothetical protein
MIWFLILLSLALLFVAYVLSETKVGSVTRNEVKR